MTKHSCAAVAVLAAVLVAVAPAGAGYLNFTFEDPPYTAGDVNGQNGWYQEETVSTPAVAGLAPLAGSQSLVLIGDSFAPRDQRIWHGLADQTFTDVLTIEYLVRVNDGQLGLILVDATTRTYYRSQVDVNYETWKIGTGFDAFVTFDSYGPCKSGHLYQVTVTLDFQNHRQRTTVWDLTDSLPVIDTGLLDLNAGTTTANAATDNLHTGMRLLGGHDFTTHSEGLVDDFRFVPPPAGALFVLE